MTNKNNEKRRERSSLNSLPIVFNLARTNCRTTKREKKQLSSTETAHESETLPDLRFFENCVFYSDEGHLKSSFAAEQNCQVLNTGRSDRLCRRSPASLIASGRFRFQVESNSNSIQLDGAILHNFHLASSSAPFCCALERFLPPPIHHFPVLLGRVNRIQKAVGPPALLQFKQANNHLLFTWVVANCSKCEV